MQKEAFEPTGLIPRSIIRTFDRFLQQLFPGSESVAVQEYRVSRYQILVSLQSFCILVFIPFFVNYAAKSFVLMPLIEHFWNSGKKEIFLNAYQEKKAFAEMQDFSEKLFFESLLRETESDPRLDFVQEELSTTPQTQERVASKRFVPIQASCVANKKESESGLEKPMRQNVSFFHQRLKVDNQPVKSAPRVDQSFVARSCQNRPNELALLSNKPSFSSALDHRVEEGGRISTLFGDPPGQSQAFKEKQGLQALFQSKNLQIASRYKRENVLAIVNVFADSLTLCTLYLLSVFMKAQIIILKSFMIESIYSLSDTTKSFLLILIMDLLVGFHSLHAWEIVFASVFQHFGLPENENCILICVALFPVCLDTVFKYWIFRYLNKISPSTVVTYHSMLE